MKTPDQNNLTGALERWRAATAKPGPYQTELDPDQEAKFQKWAKSNDLNMEGQGTPTSDYDPRGFYKGVQEGTVDPEKDMGISDFDHRMHMSDKYKTPYHESFSNESVYATEHAPQWENGLLVTPAGEVKANEREPAPYQPAITPGRIDEDERLREQIHRLMDRPNYESGPYNHDQPLDLDEDEGVEEVALGPTGRNTIDYIKPPPPRSA